jgi:tetratricopeptide (TPR) repeat protein
MAAYERALGDRWDPAQRASLERKMGEAFWRRGEYEQTIEHFQRALGYLGFRLPMSRGEVRIALARELVVQAVHRVWPRKFVRPAAALTPPPIEDEGWIYIRLALTDGTTNAERFMMVSLRQINFAERNGFPLGIGFGCDSLGIALDFLGQFRLAGWYHRYGLAVAEKLQFPFALSTAYLGLQIHELYGGEPGLGLEHGRQSIQASKQNWDMITKAEPASLLAWAFAHLGDLAESVATSQELIRLGKDAEARQALCWGETALGYALRRQGNLEDAILHEQKAIELAEMIPDHIYRINAGAELGLCYLRQGNYEKALSELEICRRVRAEHRVIHSYGDVTTLNNLAEVHLWMAEQGGELRRNASLEKAKSTCRAALKEGPKMRPKLPKAMRLQGTCEWLSGKPTAAQKWWNKSLAEVERMGLRYDIGMVHFEMGQRLGERPHLEKAEKIFAEIGAEFDLARTKKVLAGKNGG